MLHQAASAKWSNETRTCAMIDHSWASMLARGYSGSQLESCPLEGRFVVEPAMHCGSMAREAVCAGAHEDIVKGSVQLGWQEWKFEDEAVLQVVLESSVL